MFKLSPFKSATLILLFVSGITACKKDDNVFKPSKPGGSDTTGTNNDFSCDINEIEDTYPAIASGSPNDWGPYNVHDPSIIWDGEYYYCYNTDVAYGQGVTFGTTAGHQIRRSKDLVCWQYRGTAFSAYPPKGRAYIENGGGVPNENLWAPYIIEHNGEYRLYYSLASDIGRLSCIGVGISSSPEGPFTERDIVVSSTAGGGAQTNAIDPTIIKTSSGPQFMYYGSSWDGIYRLELDPATGLSKNPGSRGTRVAHRGFTGGTINGNIEGPEIIYNEEFGKYYLFIAYDWLSTKYNVRVMRSDNPEGPFYDYNGVDAYGNEDNGPMILAPYNFIGHQGWQGVSHQAVYRGEDGAFYLSHQGRPVAGSAYMVLHTRRIFWTEDGWPVVSPQRYAGLTQEPVAETELAGDWEQIVFGYTVVPGFSNEQTFPDLQSAIEININADGSVSGGSATGTWTYNSPWLTIEWSNGFTDKVHVSRGRDWENKVESTLVFTGLNNEGTAVWGKKVN